jgi:endonuclease YncB( thermonuclease family)
MKINRLLSAAFGLVGSVISSVGFAGSAPATSNVYVFNMANTPATIKDGDTFQIGGLTFRVHGADTPERKQSYKLPDGTTLQAGEEARKALSFLLAYGKLECVKVSMSYKRIVSVCTIDGRDIAVEMVRQGLAVVDTRFTSGWYEVILKYHEAQAKLFNLGIWQAQNPQMPWDHESRAR